MMTNINNRAEKICMQWLILLYTVLKNKKNKKIHRPAGQELTEDWRGLKVKPLQNNHPEKKG